MRLRMAACILSLLCTVEMVSAQPPSTPPAPAARQPVGEPSSSQVQEFAPYKLVTGVSAEGAFSSLPVAGRLTRMIFLNPEGRSTQDVFEDHRKALQSEPFETLYSCTPTTCGPSYARRSWNSFNGLFAAADGDPYYLAGKRMAAETTTYFALMVGRSRTQLDIVDVRPLKQDLVVTDVIALAKGLDTAGRVSADGLVFDMDLAALKPESSQALGEIAKLLEQRPALRLFIVGHTDMEGELPRNLDLSEARAKAVVAALVRDHGVAAERLEARGVGPLAPAASNASAAGRALNRRIELVAR